MSKRERVFIEYIFEKAFCKTIIAFVCKEAVRKNISKKNILLNDDVIEGDSLFFKGFKSFKVSLKNPGEGLDYGGITLIPYTSRR